MKVIRNTLAVLICVLLFSAIVMATGTKPSPNRYLDDFPSSVSWKVDNDGLSSFWATRYDGQIIYWGTNGSDIVQAAVNASSAAGGGCVYVMPGSFSGSVTVKDGVRLILEKGASGLTVAVNAGATSVLEDWNSGVTDYYYSGSVVAYINWTAGTTDLVPSWQGSWNTTVQQVIDAYSGMAWKGGWNTTVAQIVNATLSGAWSGTWNSTVVSIIAGASISWSKITDANLTVQQLVVAYQDFAWQGGWNTTVAQLIETQTWLNTTNVNVSGNVYFNQGQAVNMTTWNGAAFPSNPVEAQPFELTTNHTYWYWNSTAWVSLLGGTGATGPAGPAGSSNVTLPYTYIVFTNATSNYAENANGNIAYSGSNPRVVLESVYTALGSAGGSVFIKAGNYQMDQWITTMGNNTVTYGEGRASRLYVPASQPDNWGSYTIFAPDNVQNVTIRDLCVDGQDFQNNATTKFAGMIWIKNGCRHINIENVYVVNVREYGVLISSTTTEVFDVNIKHCTFIRGGLWNCITFWGGGGVDVHDCSVDGNYFEGWFDIGINVQGTNCYSIAITNNVLYKSGTGDAGSETPAAGFGIKIEASRDNFVSNNLISAVNRGISDDANVLCYRNTFTNNHVILSGLSAVVARAGICVSGCNETVTDNTVEGGFYSGGYGIVVGGLGDNNTFVGNTIKQAGTYAFGGVYLDSGNNYNDFVANNYRTCSPVWTNYGTGNLNQCYFDDGGYHA